VAASPDELSPALITPTSDASPSMASLPSEQPFEGLQQKQENHRHDKRPEGLIAEALLSGQNVDGITDEDEGFDYLGYAKERAMFFWGDMVTLGLVKKEELPEELRRRLKIVPY